MALIVGAVAYMELKGAPFVFDDLHTIRDNPNIQAHLSPIYFFKNPQSASLIPSTLVRPLLTWTYAADFHRAGADPDAFRLVNFLLHLINSILIAAITRATRFRRLAPLAGAIFFLHPLSSIQIGYVSCRSTLLSGFFYLAALAIFSRLVQAGNDGEERRTRTFIAIVSISALFGLGLLCKASASTLPAALVLWGIAFSVKGGRGPEVMKRHHRLTLAAAAATFAVLIAYFAYRHLSAAPSFFPPARPWPVWSYLASQATVFWTYTRLVLFPVQLSIEHDAWRPQTAADLLHPCFVVSCLAIALVTRTGHTSRPSSSYG